MIKIRVKVLPKEIGWKVFVFSAVLIAMSIVFTRFFSINIGTSIRIGFGRFPIMLASIYYGPIFGLFVGAIADFLGAKDAKEILFTSCATESANTAIRGVGNPILFSSLLFSSFICFRHLES